MDVYGVSADQGISREGRGSRQNGCQSNKLISYLAVTLLSWRKVDYYRQYYTRLLICLVHGILSTCLYTCCSKVYFPRWMCSTRTRIVLLSLSVKSSRLCLILRAQYVRCMLMWNSSRSCLISALITTWFNWGSFDRPVKNNKTQRL